jgi:uncharacterized protein DUF2017
VVFGWGRRVRRVGKGQYELKLPEDERSVLRTLPAQLRALLTEGDAPTADPSLARLFPPAYLDDEERSAEFRRLVHDDLVASKMAAAEVVEATVDKRRLTEDELVAWMGALNDLRLVLGTRLDVTEDLEEPPADSPDAPLYALYYYLGVLQEQVVAALDPEY